MIMNIDTDLVKKYHNTHSKDSNIIKYACEYRVLATLRYFYPKEYENMEHSDSPDLQDKSNKMGIEVINAISSKDAEATSLFSKMKNSAPKQNQKLKNVIKKCDYTFSLIEDDKYSIGKTGTGDGEKIVFQESIRKKLNKLHLYKTKFAKVGLAILLPEPPTSFAEEHCIEWILEAIEDSKNTFDIFYVISHRFCITFDFQNNKNEKIKIDSEVNQKLRKIARMTAEGKLSLDDLEWQ